MDNETKNIDFEQLMKKRQSTLDATLDSLNQPDLVEADSSKLGLAEINYISNFYNGKSSYIVDRILSLKELISSRSFTSQEAKKIVGDKTSSIISEYGELIETSKKSTAGLHVLRLIFFLIGLLFLGATVICFMGGMPIVVTGIVLVISLCILGKGIEYNESIDEIKGARNCINKINKIIRIEGNQIVFL